MEVCRFLLRTFEDSTGWSQGGVSCDSPPDVRVYVIFIVDACCSVGAVANAVLVKWSARFGGKRRKEEGKKEDNAHEHDEPAQVLKDALCFCIFLFLFIFVYCLFSQSLFQPKKEKRKEKRKEKKFLSFDSSSQRLFWPHCTKGTRNSSAEAGTAMEARNSKNGLS